MADPEGFRLAVAQSPGELSGVEARLSWLANTLRDMEHADLLLLPECFTCGYNIPDHVGDLAEPADGSTAQRIAALAKEHGVAICYGYAERAGEQVFNSAQCIAPDGRSLHNFRKLALPPGFEPEVYAPGVGAGTFTYLGVTIGVLICYDVEFPETVRHVAAQGSQVILVPTALGADWPWVANTLVPARAYENGVYVAYADHCGSENGRAYFGGSVIAGPFGKEAARAQATPTVLYATIDLNLVAYAQSQLPYVTDRLKLSL